MTQLAISLIKNRLQDTYGRRMEFVSGPVEAEAASAGFYEHRTNKLKFPRLQLRTVKELMEGKGIERPTSAAAIEETFKKAPESKMKHGHQPELTI